MSVRHIHAKQGEYIAVHRSGNRKQSGNGEGGGNMGCLFLVGIILFVCFFDAILGLLAMLAILAMVGGLLFLIFIFHLEIWFGIKWFMCGLWRVLVWVYRKIQELVVYSLRAR